ncbi:MAG: hypothetical protein VX921_05630 [Chloroflexota bacterium]|nr:hypothetical protein [Chloroflexota bacterium]
MKQGFDDQYAFDMGSLDRVLVNVITNDKDKVISWVREEPGSWGFLAGKAVTAYRTQLARKLTEKERQIVWARLWSFLENLKAQL